MDDLKNAPLAQVDPLIAGAIDNEVARQANGLELIASENFVSEAVLEATGSVFTNKYAEGYPGKRYYAGNQHSDRLEELAIERAKKLFGAEPAEVGRRERLPHAAQRLALGALDVHLREVDGRTAAARELVDRPAGDLE